MRKFASFVVVGLLASGFLILTTGATPSPTTLDFGLFVENQLRAHSNQLFGITEPLEASSTESVDQQTAESDPTSLATVAKGLSVRVVTSAANAGANIDQMALWPN